MRNTSTPSQSDDLRCCRQWEPAIRATLSNLTELTDVNTDAQDKGCKPRCCWIAMRWRALASRCAMSTPH